MSTKPTAPPKPVAKTHTRYGTPLSSTWDNAWSTRVEETEVRLSRRICGARTIDGDPCTLFSNHDSGRCRYHGGHDLTGAPAGNRNGMLHGLFFRRLQDCGPHCPRFERCPIAGDDVAELPATNRPACPYESLEYDASVTDLSARGERLTPGDEYIPQYAHHVALLQVMVGRAARAMAAGTERGSLNAYLRLAAEYRRALGTMSPARGKAAEPPVKPQAIGLADQLRPLLKSTEGVLEEALDFERKKLAKKLKTASGDGALTATNEGSFASF